MNPSLKLAALLVLTTVGAGECHDVEWAHHQAAEGSMAATSAEPEPAADLIEFAAEIQPILEARCSPCHFPGGSMHASLPFDDPETIRKLGSHLFSRIKGEEQAMLKRFLEQ